MWDINGLLACTLSYTWGGVGKGEGGRGKGERERGVGLTKSQLLIYHNIIQICIQIC